MSEPCGEANMAKTSKNIGTILNRSSRKRKNDCKDESDAPDAKRAKTTSELDFTRHVYKIYREKCQIEGEQSADKNLMSQLALEAEALGEFCPGDSASPEEKKEYYAWQTDVKLLIEALHTKCAAREVRWANVLNMMSEFGLEEVSECENVNATTLTPGDDTEESTGE